MCPSNKDLKISQGAVVCLESKLLGQISIGTKTIVHPKASIITEGGSIIIGQRNIFEEQSLVKHTYDADTPQRPQTLTIGSNNVFEVGCTVMAKVIGDNNVFEAKCYVGPGVEVGNGCVVGAGVVLITEERLEDNLAVWGQQDRRSVASGRPSDQTLQIEFLSKVLPNYHHLRK